MGSVVFAATRYLIRAVSRVYTPSVVSLRTCTIPPRSVTAHVSVFRLLLSCAPNTSAMSIAPSRRYLRGRGYKAPAKARTSFPSSVSLPSTIESPQSFSPKKLNRFLAHSAIRPTCPVHTFAYYTFPAYVGYSFPLCKLSVFPKVSELVRTRLSLVR